MRRRTIPGLALALAACASAPPAARTTTATPVAACATPEHRQLDFWIGDWDVAVHARSAPGKDEWGDARGIQHVTAILGGCAIAEDFAAEGPGPAWAGRSYSSWQAPLGKWRQTWVDDSGSYLAFTGGVENGAMTLYGEPRVENGVTVRMRMIFLDVKPDALRWEWQRSTDDGASWLPMMIVSYTRRR